MVQNSHLCPGSRCPQADMAIWSRLSWWPWNNQHLMGTQRRELGLGQTCRDHMAQKGSCGFPGSLALPTPERQGHDGAEEAGAPSPHCPGPGPCVPLTSGNPTPCRHPSRRISDMSLSPREVGPMEQDIPDMDTSKPHVSAVSEKLATISPHCFLFRITDLAGCCPGTWPECLTSAQRSRQADLQLPRHKGQPLRPCRW